jgi:hypothetical protein
VSVLVARGPATPFEAALERLETLHDQGTAAELLSEASADRSAAEQAASQRGCSDLIWVGP